MTELTTSIVVPADHPSLSGHFPGRPLVPGVVLLDLILAAAQTLLARPAQLTAIPSAKFLKPVAPEEIVFVKIRLLITEQPEIWRGQFQATSHGAPVAEGSFLLASESVEQTRS